MKRVMTLVAVAATVVLAACGSSSSDKTSSSAAGGSQTTGSNGKTIQANAANKSKTVTIGSKNFTEEFILGQIYAQALKAGGYKVRKRLDYGSEIPAFRGVRAGK